MTIPEIQRVCFVGAGTMGCYNALVAAISGYDVVLYDVSADTLQQVPQRQAEFAEFLVPGGYCSREDIGAALGRIRVMADLAQATHAADLVSESVFERLDIKREIHRQLDQLCPPHTILTTNSSALLVSDIEDVVTRGDRFAALHSHLGAPLVDIVGGPRTDPAIIALLERYVLSLRGVPLVLNKEHRGYVLNAMLGPVLGTAMALLITGAATTDEVDSAWMNACSAPMGPFGMMDLFGLNLIHDSWQYREDEPDRRELRAGILALLTPMLARGELGVKSGKGFYDYPGPRYQQPDFLATARGEGSTAAADALVTALVGNALLLARHGVAAPAAIDRAWMVGPHLDTGPFGLLAQMGVPRLRQLLAAQVAAGRFDAKLARAVSAYLEQGDNAQTAEAGGA